MKKRFFLSAVVFILAIGGAFASYILYPFTGYSQITDVPTQGAPCEPRKTCEGGSFVCTATFVENQILYVNIPMYQEVAPNICTILLTQPTPDE